MQKMEADWYSPHPVADSCPGRVLLGFASKPLQRGPTGTLPGKNMTPHVKSCSSFKSCATKGPVTPWRFTYYFRLMYEKSAKKAGNR